MRVSHSDVSRPEVAVAVTALYVAGLEAGVYGDNVRFLSLKQPKSPVFSFSARATEGIIVLAQEETRHNVLGVLVLRKGVTDRETKIAASVELLREIQERALDVGRWCNMHFTRCNENCSFATPLEEYLRESLLKAYGDVTRKLYEEFKKLCNDLMVACLQGAARYKDAVTH